MVSPISGEKSAPFICFDQIVHASGDQTKKLIPLEASIKQIAA